MKLKKTCKNCDEKFEVPPYKNRKFCSWRCRNEGMKIINLGMNSKPKIEKKCKTCNKFFYVRPSRNHQKYCSPECYKEVRIKELIEKNIQTKGKTYVEIYGKDHAESLIQHQCKTRKNKYNEGHFKKGHKSYYKPRELK